LFVCFVFCLFVCWFWLVIWLTNSLTNHPSNNPGTKQPTHTSQSNENLRISGFRKQTVCLFVCLIVSYCQFETQHLLLLLCLRLKVTVTSKTSVRLAATAMSLSKPLPWPKRQQEEALGRPMASSALAQFEEPPPKKKKTATVKSASEDDRQKSTKSVSHGSESYHNTYTRWDNTPDWAIGKTLYMVDKTEFNQFRVERMSLDAMLSAILMMTGAYPEDNLSYRTYARQAEEMALENKRRKEPCKGLSDDEIMEKAMEVLLADNKKNKKNYEEVDEIEVSKTDGGRYFVSKGEETKWLPVTDRAWDKYKSDGGKLYFSDGKTSVWASSLFKPQAGLVSYLVS
jgi:hypothetical protein